MAKRPLVHCRICKGTIDRDNQNDWIMPKEKWYYHSACYGDETQNILMEICGLLQALGQVAKMNPYTSTLAPLFDRAKSIQDNIPGISSSHVKIDYIVQ